MSDSHRLPRTVEPQRYEITLTPDLGAATFAPAQIVEQLEPSFAVRHDDTLQAAAEQAAKEAADKAAADKAAADKAAADKAAADAAAKKLATK